jgi:hypothetical protein
MAALKADNSPAQLDGARLLPAAEGYSRQGRRKKDVLIDNSTAI